MCQVPVSHLGCLWKTQNSGVPITARALSRNEFIISDSNCEENISEVRKEWLGGEMKRYLILKMAVAEVLSEDVTTNKSWSEDTSINKLNKSILGRGEAPVKTHCLKQTWHVFKIGKRQMFLKQMKKRQTNTRFRYKDTVINQTMKVLIGHGRPTLYTNSA